MRGTWQAGLSRCFPAAVTQEFLFGSVCDVGKQEVFRLRKNGRATQKSCCTVKMQKRKNGTPAPGSRKRGAAG